MEQLFIVVDLIGSTQPLKKFRAGLVFLFGVPYNMRTNSATHAIWTYQFELILMIGQGSIFILNHIDEKELGRKKFVHRIEP